MLGQELKEIFKNQTEIYRKRLQKNTFDLKYRELLLSSASGKVLEVAVGSGTNFRFYNPDVEVTAVDFTKEMLELALQESSKRKIRATFLNVDVENLEFDDNSFDTIVSTWSLCTYANPTKVLNKFNNWCKPDGQILLFEHGLNGNGILDWFMNHVDDWVLRKIGCHINRDINKLLDNSLLSVRRVEKVLLFYYLVWATPNKSPSTAG